MHFMNKDMDNCMNKDMEGMTERINKTEKAEMDNQY